LQIFEIFSVVSFLSVSINRKKEQGNMPKFGRREELMEDDRDGTDADAEDYHHMTDGRMQDDGAVGGAHVQMCDDDLYQEAQPKNPDAEWIYNYSIDKWAQNVEERKRALEEANDEEEEEADNQAIMKRRRMIMFGGDGALYVPCECQQQQHDRSY
jgi:hypothetical protein